MLARLRWHGRLAVPSLSQALALPSLPQCCSHLFAFSAYFVLKERDPLLRGDSSFHPDRETDKALPRESCTHKQPLPRSLPRSDPLSFCIRPFSGHFGDGPRVRHIFSVVPRMFPSSEVIPDVNKRGRAREEEEEDKEGYFLFRRENKMACLVGSERRRKSSEVFCPPSPRQSQSRSGGRE